MKTYAPPLPEPCRTGGPPALGKFWTWFILGLVLLAWNSFLAWHASPLTLLSYYDGAQYQLLARNRLAGNYQVGDTAQTVGREGSHPLWRPGLVWVTEGLARALGSVQAGAAAASALGTTLLELAMLWLAWRCFSLTTFVAVAVFLFAFSPINTLFVHLAVGQGPEPWSAALLLWGLAGLVGSSRHTPCAVGNGTRSVPAKFALSLAAGGVAGLAEWFRTGNLLLFAIPCVVFALAALYRREWLGSGIAGTALTAFAGMVYLGALLVPSPVAKTVVNLRHNLVESSGPIYPVLRPDGAPRRFVPLGILQIVPGTAETYADYLVRAAHHQDTLAFVEENAETLFYLYGDRLGQVMSQGGSGFRQMAGSLVVLCFLGQVMRSLIDRDNSALLSLALAGAALAHILGPITLLVGNTTSVYLLVPLPLVILVAGHGAAYLGGWLVVRLPVLVRTPMVIAGLAVVAIVTGLSLSQAVSTLRHLKARAQQDSADLAALQLEGRVMCRAMAWFADRAVEPVLLPYAPVAELEEYVRARGAAGILLRANEDEISAWANPYGTIQDLERELQKSGTFSPSQVSGNWRWYSGRSQRSEVRGESL